MEKITQVCRKMKIKYYVSLSVHNFWHFHRGKNCENMKTVLATNFFPLLYNDMQFF